MTVTKDTQMTECLKCGTAIPAGGGSSGRPKSYCLAACRRAAELEIRRLDQRVGALEAQLMRTRLSGHLTLTPTAELEAEIARQERRLTRLLSARESDASVR